MATRNNITGDFIKSRTTNQNYRDGYEDIFRKPVTVTPEAEIPSAQNENPNSKQEIE